MLKLRRKHVKGDLQARFRENAGVKLPCVTRLAAMQPPDLRLANESRFHMNPDDIFVSLTRGKTDKVSSRN